MSILSKILVVLVVVLVIAVSVSVLIVHRDSLTYKTNYEAAKTQLEKTYAVLLQERSQAMGVQKDQTAQIETLNATITRLQAEVASKVDDVKSKNVDVQKLIREVENLKLQLTAFSNVAQQEAKLRETIEGILGGLRTKVDAVQKDYNQVSQKLTQTEAEKAFLIQENKLQREQIDLLRKQLADVTGKQGGTAARPAAGVDLSGVTIKGRVTAVEADLATVNVGRADGVEPGMRFTVFRGPAYLAELVVSRVEADRSVGRLELVKQQVQVDDSAWNKLEEN